LKLQERKSEIGAAGESIALNAEKQCLRTECGCPDPDRDVRQVSLEGVGRGYDIESTWPGHERSIEVKTSTRASAGFFVTANDWKVPAGLGRKAWLYRVRLEVARDGELESTMCDPMNSISESAFSPASWRVELQTSDD
jgi:hypothetical protein